MIAAPLPKWLGPLAVFLVLVAYSTGLVFFGKAAGRSEVQAAWEAQKAEDARLVSQTVWRQSELTIATEAAAAAVLAQEKSRHERILAAARTELRESELARVALSRELVRLYNDAAGHGGTPAAPADPGGAPGAPAPTCADAVERAIENAGIANRNAERVEQLQRFYNEQRDLLKQ